MRDFASHYGHFALPIVSIVLLFFLSPSFALSDRILIFAIAAIGLAPLWGQAGLVSFGQGIFFGGGAYAAGLAILHWHSGLLETVVLGMLVGFILAVVIGALCIRRSGIYFVLLTFAFAEMFAFLVYAFGNVTGGENGLLGVSRPVLAIGGHTIFRYDGPIGMYALISIAFILVYLFVSIVNQSPFGSVLRAIRDNELRARFIGYNPSTFKILAFAISGAITGLAGALFTLLLRSVPPSVMQLSISEEILVMAIIGGRRYLYGSFIGALLVVLLSDELSYFWARWKLVLGLVLIVIVFVQKAQLTQSSTVRRVLAPITDWLRGGSDAGAD
jgi:branched-chain amino acid transport system permease protein